MTTLQVLLMVASGYCCPPYCHFTASGTQVQLGSVAHRSLPFGTRLEVDGIPWPLVVDDRGVPEGVVDVFFGNDCQAARNWGRRRVTVRILGDAE